MNNVLNHTKNQTTMQQISVRYDYRNVMRSVYWNGKLVMKTRIMEIMRKLKLIVTNWIYFIFCCLQISCNDYGNQGFNQNKELNSEKCLDTLFCNCQVNICMDKKSKVIYINCTSDSIIETRLLNKRNNKLLTIGKDTIKLNTETVLIRFFNSNLFFSNNKYLLSNNKLQLLLKNDTLNFIDNSWISVNRIFDEVLLKKIILSNKHRTFGSNFLTTYEVIDISDSKLKFLIGSNVYVKGLKINKEINKIENCILYLPNPEKYTFNSLPNYSFYGLGIK